MRDGKLEAAAEDEGMSAFHSYERSTCSEPSTSGNDGIVQRHPAANIVSRLTLGLMSTYRSANPSGFGYSLEANPRRALTKPSDGTRNDGYDNDDNDLIMHVNDVLINSQPANGADRRYVVQEMLGQGTFGQVAACWSDHFGKVVAVKVIKNQPAYYHQARVEIGLLQLLNTRCDPADAHRIVRMMDYFLYRKHLCLVFEKLDVNLFELLKRNSFRGLSLTLVQLFLRQILDALTVLRDAAIIHCDLKPENILLKSSASGDLKLIDFGSACFEGRTVYSYIQSRFYRSPEVVLGCTYTVAIDMWSFGCVAAELFLGLPLFPGASEHDLIARIDETLGSPPEWLLRTAKHTDKFYSKLPVVGALGATSVQYVRMSAAEFEAQNNCKAPAGKRYFPHTALADIIGAYPVKQGLSDSELAKERHMRESFIDFLIGVLDTDPQARWTPRQASSHPFITGALFTGPHQPPPEVHRLSPVAALPQPPMPSTTGGVSAPSAPTASGAVSASYQSAFLLATPPRPTGVVCAAATRDNRQPLQPFVNYRQPVTDDSMVGGTPGTSGRPPEGMTVATVAASAAQHAHAHAIAMATIQNMPFNSQYGFLGSSIPHMSAMQAVGAAQGAAGLAIQRQQQQQNQEQMQQQQQQQHQQADWRSDPRLLAAAAAGSSAGAAAAAAAAAIPLGSTPSNAVLNHQLHTASAAMAAAAAAAAAHNERLGHAAAPVSPAQPGMGRAMSSAGAGPSYGSLPPQLHLGPGRPIHEATSRAAQPSLLRQQYGALQQQVTGSLVGNRGGDAEHSGLPMGSYMQPALNYLAASYQTSNSFLPNSYGAPGVDALIVQQQWQQLWQQQQQQRQQHGVGQGAGATYAAGGGAPSAYDFVRQQAGVHVPTHGWLQPDASTSAARDTNSNGGAGASGIAAPAADPYDDESLLYEDGSQTAAASSQLQADSPDMLNGDPGDWDPLYTDDQLLDEGLLQQQQQQQRQHHQLRGLDAVGVSASIPIGTYQPFLSMDAAGGRPATGTSDVLPAVTDVLLPAIATSWSHAPRMGLGLRSSAASPPGPSVALMHAVDSSYSSGAAAGSMQGPNAVGTGMHVSLAATPGGAAAGAGTLQGQGYPSLQAAYEAEMFE